MVQHFFHQQYLSVMYMYVYPNPGRWTVHIFSVRGSQGKKASFLRINRDNGRPSGSRKAVSGKKALWTLSSPNNFQEVLPKKKHDSLPSLI